MPKIIKTYHHLLLLLLALTSCGVGTKNMFKSMEKENAAQDATFEMEHDRPEKAIVILEKALASDAENYVLVSLLSAAYAQKYGVDLIDIALNLASSQSSSGLAATQSSNPLLALWSILPEATDDTLGGVGHAVDLLISIPLDKRREADSFKLGILSMVNASLQLKALDLNGDGELSVQELLGLNADNADAILVSLLGAAEATAALSGDSNSAKVAQQIDDVYTTIKASDGTTDAEKLSSYLSKN